MAFTASHYIKMTYVKTKKTLAFDVRPKRDLSLEKMTNFVQNLAQETCQKRAVAQDMTSKHRLVIFELR